jgi:hypothetical protein
VRFGVKTFEGARATTEKVVETTAERLPGHRSHARPAEVTTQEESSDQ